MELDLNALQMLPAEETQPSNGILDCTVSCTISCAASCTVTCGLTAVVKPKPK